VVVLACPDSIADVHRREQERARHAHPLDEPVGVEPAPRDRRPKRHERGLQGQPDRPGTEHRPGWVLEPDPRLDEREQQRDGPPIDEIQYQMAQDQRDDHRRDIEVATDDPLSEKERQADRHQRDERVEQAGRPEELVDVREQAESGQRQRPRLREQVAAQHVRRRQRDEQVREEIHA